jgi:hypothetical protein
MSGEKIDRMNGTGACRSSYAATMEKQNSEPKPPVNSERASPRSRPGKSPAELNAASYVKREAIYPRVYVDMDGDPLDGSFHYQIVGSTDMHAVWWVVTIYDERFQLFADMERHSFTSSNIATTDEDTRFVIDIAPELPKGAANWLPCRAGQTFNLVWKLYMPGARVIEAPGHFEIPRVVKVMD